MIAIVKLEISNGRAAKENCSSSVFYLLSFTCLPTSLLIQRPPGAIVFSCCVLTDSDMASSRWSLRGRYLSLREERYRRKTRQRAPKPPFGFWLLYGGRRGDVRTSYEFAQVQLTRFRLVRRRAGGVRFARLRRKAKHRLFATISLPQALLPPDSCLLLQVQLKSWHSKNNQRYSNLAVGWLRECKPFHRSAARRGKGISGAHPKGICFAAPQPT